MRRRRCRARARDIALWEQRGILGAMIISFPGETAEYRSARDLLLDQEVALRRQMEQVAAARRALPLGGPLREDYEFDASPTVKVRFSQLFEQRPSLAIYTMMFPRDPADTRPGAASGETSSLALIDAPCPSCTALLDQLDGAIEHVAPHLSFAVVAKAPIARVLTFARERHWKRLRMLSASATAYNRDYHGEDSAGRPRPMLNVFSWNGGAIRHHWGSEMLYAPTEPAQIRVTSGRSNRCGTSSISLARAAERTGRSNSSTPVAREDPRRRAAPRPEVDGSHGSSRTPNVSSNGKPSPSEVTIVAPSLLTAPWLMRPQSP